MPKLAATTIVLFGGEEATAMITMLQFNGMGWEGTGDSLEKLVGTVTFAGHSQSAGCGTVESRSVCLHMANTIFIS